MFTVESKKLLVEPITNKLVASETEISERHKLIFIRAKPTFREPTVNLFPKPQLRNRRLILLKIRLLQIFEQSLALPYHLQ